MRTALRVHPSVSGMPPTHRVTLNSLVSTPSAQRSPIRKAAIVTCGGLCPGINTVITDLARHLTTHGSQVYAVMNGFRGLYDHGVVPWQQWSRDNSAGSLLKVARGGWSLEAIKQGIGAHELDAVFAVGGDGTHRGLTVLSDALPATLSLVGIPKTIDNDIYGFDRCFGFHTAVDEAVRAVHSACTEAASVSHGLAIVKLMGRHSGHIALTASVAHGGVDICLLPEVKFSLSKVLQYAQDRLSTQGKCVIVVAEGSGYSVTDRSLQSSSTDASGNPALPDIGTLLLQEIKALRTEAVVKYIDPSYMLRGGPPVTSDLHLCAELALGAALGCAAGYTAFSVGPVGGEIGLLPLDFVTREDNGNWRSGKTVANADKLLRFHLRQPSLL